jgi:hypothetical protein
MYDTLSSLLYSYSGLANTNHYSRNVTDGNTYRVTHSWWNNHSDGYAQGYTNTFTH